MISTGRGAPLFATASCASIEMILNLWLAAAASVQSKPAPGLATVTVCNQPGPSVGCNARPPGQETAWGCVGLSPKSTSATDNDVLPPRTIHARVKFCPRFNWVLPIAEILSRYPSASGTNLET